MALPSDKRAKCEIDTENHTQLIDYVTQFILLYLSQCGEEGYIRRGLNPQRAFTGLISSMIHSASKQLEHVEAIFPI